MPKKEDGESRPLILRTVKCGLRSKSKCLAKQGIITECFCPDIHIPKSTGSENRQLSNSHFDGRRLF